MMRKFAWLLVTSALFVSSLRAQTSAVDSLISAVESAFNNGLYESAELSARRLLETQNLRNLDRIACERLIASSLIAQGRPQIAKEHFLSILRIDPSFDLDPVITSPKILSVFEETKRQFRITRSVDSTLSSPRDLGSRPITFRAAVFPGWEQLHQGRATTGTVGIALGVISLGSGIVTEILRSSARKDYLDATQPGDIAAKYSTYNRYYHAETYSFIMFALTYIASEVEVFTNNAQAIEAHLGGVRNQAASITLSYHF